MHAQPKSRCPRDNTSPESVRRQTRSSDFSHVSDPFRALLQRKGGGGSTLGDSGCGPFQASDPRIATVFWCPCATYQTRGSNSKTRHPEKETGKDVLPQSHCDVKCTSLPQLLFGSAVICLRCTAWNSFFREASICAKHVYALMKKVMRTSVAKLSTRARDQHE